ncbi:hypothetical protein HHI36_016665 [Cryptolaemus montrouzieri]|uniref:Uncharacterized protein n=1 Tax=Cryptolaemus montrouzieri TaxID=559131 RepID=A0ABD2NK64_9CUCU
MENHSISDFMASLQKDICDCDFHITCGCNKQVSCSEIFLRAQFIRGLKDNWIREYLLQSNVTNFDELFNEAVALKASRIESKEISNQQNTSEVPGLNKLSRVPQNQNDVPVQQQPIYDANDEEEDEEDDGVTFSESDLKFEDFVKRLAHPKIVRATSLALARFEENSVYTNTCIVKLMHRISFDCKMYVMMFQISLFMTFRKIYALKAMPEYKELVRFANFMLRQFFKLAETNKKIFMEALFWKSTKDAYDVEHGYGSYLESSKAAARAWTEDEEDEVRRLFMEHTEKQLEDDVVDWVTANLIDNTRTRRGVLKKLKELFLLTDYKGPKKVRNTSRLPQQWSIDEEEQLKELYEQFKDAMDPMGCIIDRLTVPRPKNRIIEKMLILGLIQDRKEVRKKRVKGARKSKSGESFYN